MIRSMRNRFPRYAIQLYDRFRSWMHGAQLFPQKAKPKELSTFKRNKKGDKYTAVSTPGVYLCISGQTKWGCAFEFASIIDEKLKGVVESVDEKLMGSDTWTEKQLLVFRWYGISCRDENPYYFAAIGNEDPRFCRRQLCVCAEVHS